MRARAVREIGWVLAGQVVAAVGAVAGVALLSRALEPAEYGHLTLALTTAALAQQVVLGPLTSALARFFATAVEHDDVDPYLRAVRALIRRGLVRMAALAGAAVVPLLLVRREDAAIAVLTAVFAAVSGSQVAAAGMLTAMRHRRAVAIHQGMSVCARFALAAVFLRAWGGGAPTVVAAFLVIEILTLVSELARVRSAARRLSRAGAGRDREVERTYEVRMASYAQPMALWNGLTWVQMSIDRYALAATRNVGAVGEYAVLSQLGFYPLALLCAASAQLMSPIVFSRAGDASDEGRLRDVQRLVRHLVLVMLAVTAAVAAAAALLHETVFSILVAPEYARVSHLLPLVVLVGGFFATGQLAALGPMARANPKGMVLPKLVTSAVWTVAAFLGGAFGGITGVVVASVGSAGLYAAWICWLNERGVVATSDESRQDLVTAL